MGVVDVIAFLDGFDNSIIMLLIVAVLIVEVFLLAFPKEIVMVYAGVKFGTGIGGVLNLIGLIGAAVLGYEGGRAGRFGLEKRRKERVIQKYEEWLKTHGMKALAVFRFFPLTPNDVLSISSGFARLSRLRYNTITSIVAVPYAFFFAWIGSTQLDLVIDLLPTVVDPTLWITTFIFFIVLGIILIRRGTTSLETIDKNDSGTTKQQ